MSVASISTHSAWSGLSYASSIEAWQEREPTAHLSIEPCVPILYDKDAIIIRGPFPSDILAALEIIQWPEPSVIHYTALQSVSQILEAGTADSNTGNTTKAGAVRTILRFCDTLLETNQLLREAQNTIIACDKLILQLEEVMTRRIDGRHRTDRLASLLDSMVLEMKDIDRNWDFRNAMKSRTHPNEVDSFRHEAAALLAQKWRAFHITLTRVEEMWNDPVEHDVSLIILACGAAPRVEVANDGRDFLAGGLEQAWEEVLRGSQLMLPKPPQHVAQKKMGKEVRRCGKLPGLTRILATVGRWTSRRSVI